MIQATQDVKTLQPTPRWLEHLLGLPLAAGILLLCWLLLVLNLKNTSTSLFVFLLSTALVRGLLRRFQLQPTVQKVLGWLLWAFAFLAWSGLAYLAFLISPFRLLTGLGLITIAFYLEHSNRTRLPLAAFALLLAALLSVVPWHSSLALLMLPAAIFIAFRFTREQWYPRGSRWFLLLFVLIQLTVLLPYRFALPANQAESIAEQPDVTLLYDANDQAHPYAATLGREVRFARPDCRGRPLIGTRSMPSGLVRLDVSQLTSSAVGEISDVISIDCKNKRIFAGDWKKGESYTWLYVLNHETLALESSLDVFELHHISQTEYDSLSQTVFAAAYDEKVMHTFNYFLQEPLSFPTQDFVFDFAVFPEHDLLVLCSWGGRLDFYRLSDYQPIDSYRLPTLMPHFARGPEQDTFWLACPLRGKLVEFSLTERRPVGRIQVEPGVNTCVFDPENQLIFTGNYLSGEVSVRDGQTYEVKQKYQVGKHLRSLHLIPKGRYLLAASAFGATRIDLPR